MRKCYNNLKIINPFSFHYHILIDTKIYRAVLISITFVLIIEQYTSINITKSTYLIRYSKTIHLNTGWCPGFVRAFSVNRTWPQSSFLVGSYAVKNISKPLKSTVLVVLVISWRVIEWSRLSTFPFQNTFPFTVNLVKTFEVIHGTMTIFCNDLPWYAWRKERVITCIYI